MPRTTEQLPAAPSTRHTERVVHNVTTPATIARQPTPSFAGLVMPLGPNRTLAEHGAGLRRPRHPSTADVGYGISFFCSSLLRASTNSFPNSNNSAGKIANALNETDHYRPTTPVRVSP